MAKEPFENRKTPMHKRLASGEPLNGQHLRSGGKVKDGAEFKGGGKTKAKVGGAISAEDKDRDGYKVGGAVTGSTKGADGHKKMPASGPKLKC